MTYDERIGQLAKEKQERIERLHNETIGLETRKSALMNAVNTCVLLKSRKMVKDIEDMGKAVVELSRIYEKYLNEGEFDESIQSNDKPSGV